MKLRGKITEQYFSVMAFHNVNLLCNLFKKNDRMSDLNEKLVGFCSKEKVREARLTIT